MESLLARVAFFIIAFLIGAGILLLIKVKYKTLKINPQSIVGVIFIIGGLFNLYMGIDESQIVNIIMGSVLLVGAYFFIKKGQTIENKNV